MKDKGDMAVTSDALEKALARSTQELETWLDEVSVGEPIEGLAFNWQLFAFCVASQATNERDPNRAHVALRAYEGLAHREKDSAGSSPMYSAMNLRAWMIREFGSRKGHAVLDPEPIASWFLQLTSVPIEEARQLSSVEDLRTVPIEKLRQVRKIKNALNVLALISDSGILQGNPELEEWLQLRIHLP